MPIYEYQCEHCSNQFELLVLKATVVACPACGSPNLEQLLSGFAMSSDAIRQNNLQSARRRHASSTNYRDQKKAEAEAVQKSTDDHH
jgi:putative FmdB family regulatory protein